MVLLQSAVAVPCGHVGAVIGEQHGVAAVGGGSCKQPVAAVVGEQHGAAAVGRGCHTQPCGGFGW